MGCQSQRPTRVSATIQQSFRFHIAKVHTYLVVKLRDVVKEIRMAGIFIAFEVGDLSGETDRKVMSLLAQMLSGTARQPRPGCHFMLY